MLQPPRKPRATNLGGPGKVATRNRAMVGVQAHENITIVDVQCKTCIAAAQGCFKRSIRHQSRRRFEEKSSCFILL
jgi:hypothetical protein